MQDEAASDPATTPGALTVAPETPAFAPFSVPIQVSKGLNPVVPLVPESLPAEPVRVPPPANAAPVDELSPMDDVEGVPNPSLGVAIGPATPDVQEFAVPHPDEPPAKIPRVNTLLAMDLGEQNRPVKYNCVSMQSSLATMILSIMMKSWSVIFQSLKMVHFVRTD